MPRIGFEQLPEHARLWIFAAQRELDDPERARVLEEVDRFIDQWTAHDVPLTAARDWRQGRFLMIGVDEEAAGLSGCSIDALVRRMKVVQEELGVELVNNAPVLFKNGGTIERISRERFAELASSEQLASLEPMGHYAYNIAFKDGHETGIYSFEYLRSICECDECRPKAT